MSRRPPTVPKYVLHKASGQAVVRMRGNDIYLGKHGSPESHERYARIVAQWTRQQRMEALKTPMGTVAPNLSIAELNSWYRSSADNTTSPWGGKRRIRRKCRL